MDNKLCDAGLSAWARIVAAIAISSLMFLLTRQPWVDSATLNDPKAAPRAVSPRGELWSDERSTIGLFKQASPAGVNITAIGVQRDLFTLNLYQIPQGTGSGFVWGYQRQHYHQFSRDSECRCRPSNSGRSRVFSSARKSPGRRSVTLALRRDGKTVQTKVTLEAVQ